MYSLIHSCLILNQVLVNPVPETVPGLSIVVTPPTGDECNTVYVQPYSIPTDLLDGSIASYNYSLSLDSERKL